MKALFIDGPRAGEVDDHLADPLPYAYMTSTFHDDHLEDGLVIAPGQEIPTLRMEEHLYELVERPAREHYRLLADREVPKPEWDAWAFYVHAPGV